MIRRNNNRFALQLTLILGTFLMVGSMAMLARDFGDYRGSIRTTQHNRD